MILSDFQSSPSRQLHLRPGSPMNGVLEGREPLAGGATKSRSETTGSYHTSPISSRRAPAGAREARGGSQSGPHSPLCGTPSVNGHSLAALSPRSEDCNGLMANGNAPAFDAPHRGLCGPHFSRPFRALPSSTMGNRVDPVVAPPANFFRASGTTGSRDHFRDVTKMVAANVAGYGVATIRRPSGCFFGDDSSPFPTSSPVSLPR